MVNPKRLYFVALTCFLIFGNAWGQETKEVRKSGPLNPDGKVYVDTYKGSITVTTWDKAEIDIYAKIEPDGFDRYAEEKVQDTEIRTSLSSSSVRIKTDYDHVRQHSSFWGIFDGETGSLPFVHYTIKMPRTARLVIKDYKSETNVTDLRSDADIETYKGEVKVMNLEGSLVLETYKGEVTVDFASLKGRSRFETYKGQIEVRFPKGTGFDLDADIGRRGDFSNEFEGESRYRSKRDRDAEYQTSVNGGGPLVLLKTTKGSIRLAQR
jgi:hypothetical protein